MPDTPEIPLDDAMAQLFLKSDLIPIDHIKSFNEAHFAIGFAFENGKSFYFADGAKWPLGETFVTVIAVGWEGFKGKVLVKACAVKMEAWNKFSITDINGKEL